MNLIKSLIIVLKTHHKPSKPFISHLGLTVINHNSCNCNLVSVIRAFTLLLYSFGPVGKRPLVIDCFKSHCAHTAAGKSLGVMFSFSNYSLLLISHKPLFVMLYTVGTKQGWSQSCECSSHCVYGNSFTFTIKDSSDDGQFIP